MKQILSLLLLFSTALHASDVSYLPTSINENGKSGLVIKGPGGSSTSVGIPNQLQFSPNVYAGGVEFDFGDPATPGYARDLSATSSFFAMVKDASNNLVVCGFGRLSPGDNSKRFITARYTSAGVLDTTFGDLNGAGPARLGYVQEDNFNLSEARGLAIQSDGKIVVCGWSTQSTVVTWTVVRYNTNGTRDTGFNSGGTSPGAIFETELGIGIAYSVSIGSTGLLYVGGYTTPASVSVITTISYTTTGARNPLYNP